MAAKKKQGTENTVQEIALRNLGVKNTDEINAWFKKSYAGLYRIDGIDEGIDLLLSRQWDLVRIIGDYDVDGTTSTAEMRLGLSILGFSVEDRIPKRISEGFGLNPVIVEEVKADGDVLLITVDNGIASIDAVALAKKKGYHVIVIDHHEPVMADGVPCLPDADVIIDPHAITGSADYKEYCGAGLAYRFLKRLIDRMGVDGKKGASLKAILETLAMMGTIADVVELREENYVIARNGLAKLEKRCATPGVLALHDKLYITNPTAADIGFKSGPCINANGRLFDDGAGKSVDLLSCTNYQKAEKLAQEAIANNNTRKQQVRQGVAMAKNIIAANSYEKDLPMVVYLPKINEGIIGIIAGKLQEAYGTVACVFTDAENGVLKGSGRSTSKINLKDLLDAFGDLFVKYGGHAGAAGMSITKENLEDFREKSNKYAKKHGMSHEVKDTVFYDLEISAEQVKESLDETLKFAPFGQGNPAIIFKVTGFRLNEMQPKGSVRTKKVYVGENGVKLTSDYCQAIGFGDDLIREIKRSNAGTLTLYGSLSYNYFRGDVTPQIEFIDFDEEIEADADETPLMRAIRALAAESKN